jgi:hypothetical protein
MEKSNNIDIIVASAHASAHFALSCLEECGDHLRAKSSFVTPDKEIMHWHEFGDLEGPGWAANAVGGAHLLYRWGKFMGEMEMQNAALSLLDHILEFGFIDDAQELIWPYFDIGTGEFCWNYTHDNDWLCPGSLAKIGVQLLEFALDLDKNHRCSKMRIAAYRLGTWMKKNLPSLSNGWAPRRITPDGKAFPYTPGGQPDPIYEISADGLFVIQLWTLLVKVGFDEFRSDAERLGETFIRAGGWFGSINHDTYDEHESVAYACAFRILCQCADILGKPAWRDFTYRHVLPELSRYRILENRNGLPTRGLLWMEESWNTAYLWENAEAAQAYLEAWVETGDESSHHNGLGILMAMVNHHHGSEGFLTEGVDWDNHVGRRHHIDGGLYEDIRYTEPLLNNIHLLGPTLFFLKRIGHQVSNMSRDRAIRIVNQLKNNSRHEPVGQDGVKYWMRFYHPALATDERLAQALDFTKRSGADGVLLFEASYDMDPAILTLDELAKRYERLRFVVPEFRKLVPDVHINTMITLGHVDAGSARPERFKFQFMVSEDGIESRSTACPLDPIFQMHAASEYKLAAQTGADVIWVDDDTRYLFHDFSGMACFCPLHLLEFGAICGRKWRRNELVDALKDDKNQALRTSWFDFQEKVILDLASTIESSIHEVDPRICIGLMSVGQSIHAAEGRKTDRLLRTLAGKELPPMLRPGSGYWTDWAPGAVIEKAFGCQRELDLIGRDVCSVAEIENHPYTPFGKSNRLLALEMALNVVSGIPNLSLNLLSSMGGKGALEPVGTDYAAFLKSQRPFLNELAVACSNKQPLGVSVIDHANYAHSAKLRGREMTAWVQPRPWEIILTRMGFPIGTFEQGPFERNGQCWLSGDVIRSLSDYELSWHFRAGAILDPIAVQALLERGWGERLGILDAIQVNDGVNEFYSDEPLNGEYAGEFLPVYNHIAPGCNYTWGLVRGQGRILSTWLNVDGDNLGPATVLLEFDERVYSQEFSQRLMLVPYVIHTPTPILLNIPRRTQWRNALEWLAGRELPIFIGKGFNIVPYAFTNLELNEWLFPLVNLSADDQVVGIRLGWIDQPDHWKISQLTKAGNWRDCELELSPDSLLDLPVEAFSMAVIRAKRR